MTRRKPPTDLSAAVESECAKLSALTADLGEVLEAALEKVKPPDVPSIDWCRAYRAYEQSVATLLAERRRNAALLAGAPEAPLPDHEYQAALDELVEQRIRKMDDTELGRIMLDKMNNEPGRES